MRGIGRSEVRIIEGQGEWICRECELTRSDLHLSSREVLDAHLGQHRAAGHHVPEGGLAELLAEGAPR
jgi:hypothetical protein